MWKVAVDHDKCRGTEDCVDSCPSSVYEMQNGRSTPVHADDCIGCWTCMEVCPEGACTVTEI